MNRSHALNETLKKKVEKMQENLDQAKARIKELVLCDGGNMQNNNNMFSTETSEIRYHGKNGNQSPWLDLSEIQKIQVQSNNNNNNNDNHSPNKNNNNAISGKQAKPIHKCSTLSIDPNSANNQGIIGGVQFDRIQTEYLGKQNRSPRFSNTNIAKVDIDNMANFFSNTGDMKFGKGDRDDMYSPNKS